MTSEVFNTDCLEYMRTLPDKAFQLAIADPPYGIGADKPAVNLMQQGLQEKKHKVEQIDSGLRQIQAALDNMKNNDF